ncbi:hypothetical protein ROZALSC1DRAFT_31655 [Rozella allomycis CSF55]|uniref:Uncharacterized protein n=1 Tax=Rozella allomycis (strain CSF55) TaxID=988480 RepID=A0A4V1IZ07_ROZAC|nr:hypothetical protein ROZALSC1DRAFT_31655 [Rozella allomycis CSF55]
MCNSKNPKIRSKSVKVVYRFPFNDDIKKKESPSVVQIEGQNCPVLNFAKGPIAKPVVKEISLVEVKKKNSRRPFAWEMNTNSTKSNNTNAINQNITKIVNISSINTAKTVNEVINNSVNKSRSAR